MLEKDLFRETCREYNPDKDVEDTGGRWGMALAEGMYREFNGNTRKIQGWFKGRINRKPKKLRCSESSKIPQYSAETYFLFLKSAEEIRDWETIKMGRLLEEFFPEVYTPFGIKPLKGKRLSEVKKEFQRRKSYAKRRTKKA